MQTQRHRSGGDRLGREDREVHAAIRFAVLAAVAGLAFVVVAAVWASTCTGAMAIDTVACGAPQRTILAFGAPVILWPRAAGHLCALIASGATTAPGGHGRVPAGFC